jgi:hypothetical protein
MHKLEVDEIFFASDGFLIYNCPGLWNESVIKDRITIACRCVRILVICPVLAG